LPSLVSPRTPTHVHAAIAAAAWRAAQPRTRALGARPDDDGAVNVALPDPWETLEGWR
jgi:hypothetical protein